MPYLMRTQTKLIMTVLSLLPAGAFAQADMTLPRWGVKTNLLYDATATINLGAEMRTGDNTSVEISGNYNNWSFKNDRKWKHYLVQPEFRYWLDETFKGHFFGAHAHWALYNVGNLPKPPFSEYMNTHRFEGWLAGAGVSYGYRYNFDHRWAIEGTLGVGYAYMKYDVFNCGKCGEMIASDKTKHYFGPTKAGISLIFGFGGKPAQPAPVYIATPPVIPPAPKPIYQPTLRAGFITPEVEAVKVRSESGEAFLDFRVGRWEILTNFRGNATELQKIYSTVELVRNNPDMTITGITIVGHASPEGTYPSNMQLSERRAASLSNHIRSVYGMSEGFIAARGEGEDWAGLDSLVAASSLAEKNAALAIIRGSEEPDTREASLRRLGGGAAYRMMFAEFYPRLRRSDYKVGYTVVPFTVEKGKQIFRTRPGDLSQNEMFMIANTYAEGSAEFNEVFEAAVQLFPASDVANLNAAANALNRGDAVSAARYLDRVKEHNAAWHNNMGVLAFMQGDTKGAADHFAQGGAQGTTNAAELLKHMESLANR